MANTSRRTVARNVTVRTSVDAVNQRGTWTDAAVRFLTEQKADAKATGIRLSPGATLKALRLIEAANPIVADALSEALVPVAVRAFNNWPIRDQTGPRTTSKGKTRNPGHSKSRLQLRWRAVSDTEFRGTIWSRAEYANLIRGGRTGLGLVWIPGRKAAVQAANRIATALGQAGD